MDAPNKQGAEKGGAAAAGEVRRINVVYFLSRGGRTDHPHLFRVNHLHRAGVRLRDVKRWLAELRGKDMPDNYSWSYKRKYKAGYVWQDLKDDDLITPISDNEYVLKGCDVRGTPPPSVQAPARTPSLAEKKQQAAEDETPCNNQDGPVEVVLTPDSGESSPKPPPPPPPADQDSPGGPESVRRRGTAPFKVEDTQGLREHQQHQQQEVVIKIEVSGSQKHHELKQQQEDEEEAAAEKAVARAEQQQQRPLGLGTGGVRRHALGRMRVARALHSMLTCGAADADDAALRPVARRQRRSAAEAAGAGDDWPPTPTCPGMDGCGLRVSRKARSRRGGKDKAGKREGRERDAHKPATLPRCSQCGKEFKPQELHAHMQSCRGFKERMRSSTSARPSVDMRHRSTAGHRGRPGHCSPERPSSASAVFRLTES